MTFFKKHRKSYALALSALVVAGLLFVPAVGKAQTPQETRAAALKKAADAIIQLKNGESWPTSIGGQQKAITRELQKQGVSDLSTEERSVIAAKIGMPEDDITIAQAGDGGGTLSTMVGFIFGKVLGGAIAWPIYILNYIVATIFGVFISISVYCIEVLLQLSTGITSSLVVRSGFNITLAVANLGFVLGIIIIAIMTILQSQTYGLKQILWKLILMAVLVNFGLSLAGGLLGFSDSLTMYFLNGINPPTSTLNPYQSFATSLAGAFAPQRVFLNIGGADNTPDGTAAVTAGNFAGAAGQNFAAIITPLLNIFFPTIFLILVVIALLALEVMILIRYVFLSILLILLPIAWLTWVFPAISSNWSEWWHSFIKWTFFTPIVVFFLYLAILAAHTMNDAQSKDPMAQLAGMKFQSTNTGWMQSLSSAFGSFSGTIIGTILQMTVMIGLVLGGLFAANSLGITFAKAASGAAQGVVKGFGGWAGRKGTGVAARGATGTLKIDNKGWRRVFNPTNRLINRVGGRLGGLASKTALGAKAVGAVASFGQKAAGSNGILKSMYLGAKDGSGLFKKVKNWTCQNCKAHTVSSATKPADDYVCPNCTESTQSMRAKPGANPKYENWA